MQRRDGVDEDEINRLLGELGIELPEVPDDLEDLGLPQWRDEDFEE